MNCAGLFCERFAMAHLRLVLDPELLIRCLKPSETDKGNVAYRIVKNPIPADAVITSLSLGTSEEDCRVAKESDNLLIRYDSAKYDEQVAKNPDQEVAVVEPVLQESFIPPNMMDLQWLVDTIQALPGRLQTLQFQYQDDDSLELRASIVDDDGEEKYTHTVLSLGQIEEAREVGEPAICVMTATALKALSHLLNPDEAKESVPEAKSD